MTMMPFHGLLSNCNPEFSKTMTGIALHHLIRAPHAPHGSVTAENEAKLSRSFDDSETAQSNAEYSFWGTCGETQL